MKEGLMVDLLKYSFELITPDLAREWLNLNIGNRSYREKYAQELSQQIRDDEWEPNNGECISFDELGDLVSGQHRLNAIIYADCPIWTHVCRGIPLTAKITVDTGRKRTIGDVLGYQGYKYAKTLGATVRVVTVIKNNPGKFMYRRTGSLSHKTIEATLRQDTQHERSVEFCSKLWNSIPALEPAKICALHYLIAEEWGDKANDFITSLSDGVALGAKNAILILRNLLINEKEERASRGQEHLTALTIIAFNKWVTNTPTSKLGWSPDRAFPTILLNELKAEL